MEYFHTGSPDAVLTEGEAGRLLDGMLDGLGKLDRVLLLPPDFTRLHSWAGEITTMLYKRLAQRGTHVEILPALGTHIPMTDEQIGTMFPGVPRALFRDHDWREGVVPLGDIPGEFVREVTEGILDFPIRCELNRLLVAEPWDRIISVGQLVPHEVIGIANQNKNLYVGVGGKDLIDKSHFVGAVHGMERIMGRAKTPVRDLLNYADAHFGSGLPISYVLTVRDTDPEGELVTRGLFAGDDDACFLRGAALCRQVNITRLDAPIRKAVVFLDPAEYHSTWLGDKAIYRTRMAMADDGELVILAPGLCEFGEDKRIDALIRQYGYRGREQILAMVRENADLAANLSAAAHLIHGSTEGRFRVTYCTGSLTREEVEGVGYAYGDLAEAAARYDPKTLRDGLNTLADGEEIYYVSNPALGLWALEE